MTNFPGGFSTFNQYRPGSDEQFYLQCHAGGPWWQDRKIGDVYIPDVFLGVFGGLQPKVVADVMAQRVDNGLAARFSLLVWPDQTTGQWVDSSPNRHARDKVERLFNDLLAFDPEQFVGPKPNEVAHYPAFRFEPAGAAVFQEWFVAHHRRLESIEPGEPIKNHLTKYDGLFARLAVVHHLIRRALGERGEAARVDEITAAAVRGFIDDYLWPHACRIYQHLDRATGYQGACRIAKWIVESPNYTCFCARDISRKEWRGLTGRDEATGRDYLRAALEYLENVAGWIRAEDIPAGAKGSSSLARSEPAIYRGRGRHAVREGAGERHRQNAGRSHQDAPACAAAALARLAEYATVKGRVSRVGRDLAG